MPTWPHEYLVRQRVDNTLFERLVLFIRVNGYQGRFYNKAITYYEEEVQAVLGNGSSAKADHDHQPV